MSVSFSLPNDEAIDFQNEVNCVAGGWAFGRRLKFSVETGRDSAAVCMEVLVVTQDYAPVELCSQKKKGQSHESLFFRPYQCDEHSEGQSSGFITFYCKGSHHKGTSVNGCRAKGPSTVRLRLLLEFGDDDLVEIFSEPFRLHARRPRKKFRVPVRYPMVKTVHRGPPQPNLDEDDTSEAELLVSPQQDPQPVITEEPKQKKRPFSLMEPPPLGGPTVKKPRLNCSYDFTSPSVLLRPNGTQVVNVEVPQLLSFPQARADQQVDEPSFTHVPKKEPGVALPRQRMTTRRASRQMSDTVGTTKMIGGPNYFPPNSLALAPLPNPFDYQTAASVDQPWHPNDLIGYYPPKETQSDTDEDSLMHHIENLLSSPPHLKKTEAQFCVIDQNAEHQVDNRVRYSPLSGDNNVVLGVYFGSTDHLHFHPEPPEAMETEDDGYLNFLD